MANRARAVKDFQRIFPGRRYQDGGTVAASAPATSGFNFGVDAGNLDKFSGIGSNAMNSGFGSGTNLAANLSAPAASGWNTGTNVASNLATPAVSGFDLASNLSAPAVSGFDFGVDAGNLSQFSHLGSDAMNSASVSGFDLASNPVATAGSGLDAGWNIASNPVGTAASGLDLSSNLASSANSAASDAASAGRKAFGKGGGKGGNSSERYVTPRHPNDWRNFNNQLVRNQPSVPPAAGAYQANQYSPEETQTLGNLAGSAYAIGAPGGSANPSSVMGSLTPSRGVWGSGMGPVAEWSYGPEHGPGEVTPAMALYASQFPGTPLPGFSNGGQVQPLPQPLRQPTSNLQSLGLGSITQGQRFQNWRNPWSGPVVGNQSGNWRWGG